MKGNDYEVKHASVALESIVGRLIRNAGYGGPSVGLNGWCWRPTLSQHGKHEFHEALVVSIKEEGVRNPILVWSLPEGMFLTFGGSRVRAAKEAGLETIPAIINDYSGRYAASDTVTPDNWQTFFTDPPREVEFGEFGFDYHYNLEMARRHNYDPNGFAWLDGDEPHWLKKEFSWL